MNFSIYFLLIICLSIIIGKTCALPDKEELEGIARRDKSITDSENLKLSKGGEISRSLSALVWKGTFNRTIDVAIKIFSDEQKMQKEIDIFQALEATQYFNIKEHRIPRVYYHGQILGRYMAIAMTLFERTLEDRWHQLNREDKNFPESTALLIFKQAVESLRYIHSKNVLHNDIHLDNIFIRGKDIFIGNFKKSKLNGILLNDYWKLLALFWQMVGINSNITSDEKVNHLQNAIVRKAFQSILSTKFVVGDFDVIPDYEEIIRISDDALAQLPGTSRI